MPRGAAIHEDEIPWNALAFRSTQEGLHDYYEQKRSSPDRNEHVAEPDA